MNLNVKIRKGKQRFSGKILHCLAGLLALSIALAACGNKDNDIQQNIVGTWIKESNYSDTGEGDTIVFTNDLSIEKYFKYFEDKGYRINYNLKTDTVFISVNSSDHVVELGFKYSINGNKLTIFRFTYPFSIVSVVREDVIFIKSQIN
jgi:hypothetical protein